jgi:cytochrome P450
MTTTASAACTTVFDARLPSLAYLDAQNPDDAHRRIRAARRQAPIALGSYGPEILTYDLARAVLRDGRFRTPPRCRLRALGITSGPLWDMNSNSLASLNGANHHRLRKLVSRAFTPCGAERLRATVVDIIAELVNPFTNAGRCDVVSDIALRYPVPVICAALGVPRADWQLFSRWADELMNLASNRGDTSSMVKSLDELHSYIDVMVADRCRKLTDDVLSELILAEADGDELEADEFRMLVGTLLTAGADTARHQLAASV